ncbi:flavin reductase [Microbacterium protaetiae]|uniref:Flavin reductase n=2 Tax=Microbacterium protaetiae TaxID=2509458 RepID=A0A4P6EHD5_9MICO|nr:flavin reductase [Microbacterium protaetiae]
MDDEAAPAHILAERPTRADEDAYKQLATLAAKSVAVVSAVQGRWDVAVTVTDFLSVSYDPPTMLVSLFSLSRIAEAVVASGRFALSVLAHDQRAIADRLGEPGAPLVGLLDQVPHRRREPGGPALVDGAIVWFDLHVAAVHTAATHLLVIGEVVATSATARWSARPLVRWRSDYQ